MVKYQNDKILFLQSALKSAYLPHDLDTAHKLYLNIALDGWELVDKKQVTKVIEELEKTLRRL